MDQRALLLFRAAGRRLAVPLSDVQRVEPVPLLHTPIGTPHFVEGFFDYRGRPVPAVRLDRLLGLGEETLGLYTPLLLLVDEEQPVALHVAKVDAILKLSAGRIQPIGKDETFNNCVAGRVSDGGETVYLLSARNLLLAAEWERIAVHRAMMQRRLDALKTEATDAARI